MISMPPLTLATLAVGVRRAVAIAGVVLPLLGAVQRRIVLVVAVVAVIEAERLRLAFLRPAPGGRRIGAVAEDAEIVLGVRVVGRGGDAEIDRAEGWEGVGEVGLSLVGAVFINKN